MSRLGVNPRLIGILTGNDPADVQSPSAKDLPGRYVQQVAKNLHRIQRDYPENNTKLQCNDCGKTAVYDIGHMYVEPQKLSREGESSPLDSFQFTQYLRCRHCNSAGQWSIPTATRTDIMLKIMAGTFGPKDNRTFSFGKLSTEYGHAPQWPTDTEEHYLKLLEENPEDAWVWNRLGNTYYRGGRADLAAQAFEQSLKYDSQQVESMFSLGKILSEIDDSQAAIPYLRQILFFARDYSRMSQHQLKELIICSLEILLDSVDTIQSFFSLLPRAELFPGHAKSIPIEVIYREIRVNPSYQGLEALAEVYLRPRPRSAAQRQAAVASVDTKVVHPKKKKPPKKKGKRKK